MAQDEPEGGMGGGEGGGGTGGKTDDKGGEADLDAILALGRIQMAFGGGQGTPVKWTGGMIGEENDSGIILGFDDGEVRRYSKEQLVDRVNAKVLKAADRAHGGLVENEPSAMAASFFIYKDKTVGIFLGEESIKLCGELPIYQDIHILQGAFAPPARASKASAQPLRALLRVGLSSGPELLRVNLSSAKRKADKLST